MNKRIFSLLTSLAMITSMASMVVSAADNEGNSTGTGGVEAIIDTDILTVTLPTVASGTFDFNMDPQSLINQSVTAGSARVTATYSTGTLFFKNTSGSYSNASDEVELKVASSMKTDISVKATVSNADGLTYSTTDDFTGTDDANKHLYLSIEKTSGTASSTALKDGSATVTEEVAALATTNFEVKWDGTANGGTGAYTYALKSGTTPTSFKFKLEGATNPNANWEGLEDVAPQIDLTWSVKEHVDPYLDATTVSTSDLTLDFTAAAGSATVTGVTMTAGTYTNLALGSSHYSATASSITFTTAAIKSTLAGGTVTITFSDGHTETITITA